MAQKAETMVRAQLLLTPAQRERLERLARREERTLSDLTRRALDIGLDALERHGEEELRRQQQILAELRCVREQVGARYGVYPGDPVAEAREERDRQQEELWREQDQ